MQEFLVLGGGGVDDFAVLRTSRRMPFDLAALGDGGHVEADVALGAGFDRAGEDLAVGEVLAAVGVDPGAAGDIDLQVGAVDR